MEAQIVVGLGFGDEGKGNFTSYLCNEHKTEKPLVIRFSGGQQAGHTVMYKGKKHIFSNYGSGTLQGVATHISEHCSFYLNTMAVEREILKKTFNINPILSVHPLAMVTTPYDVAFGRLRERTVKHGSCGLGIGTTAARHTNTGFKLHAIDMEHKGIFGVKLANIKEYYADKAAQMGTIALDEYMAEVDRLEQDYFDLINKELFTIKNNDEATDKAETLIFEGSQGIMLDKDHGIFPNVTYANTTSKNAVQICKELEVPFSINYITRCYQTRHGNGWMSNENPVILMNDEEEINKSNSWQGDFRTAELDYDLLNLAIGIDFSYCGGVENTNLVVTCLDQIPGIEFEEHKIIYEIDEIYESHSPESTKIKALVGSLMR